MTNHDTRQRILARRTRFLAAAMAGAGVASCTPGPGAGDQAPSAAPVVSVQEPGEDAAAPVEPDAGEPPDEPEPMVCLSEVAPEEPPAQPCLSIPNPQG